MNYISFTQIDIKNNKNKELDLFRQKPFFKIKNDIFLPINRKFVHELYYINIFHRLLNLNEDEKKRSLFLKNFGIALENYVVSIAHNRMNKTKYNFYPEMIIVNNDKSPDLLIINEEKKEVIVFEVKAARIMKSFVDSFLDKENFIKSINKQIEKPILQAYKAVEKMKKYKTLQLNDNYSFFYCSVTFDSIPMQNTINLELQTENGKLNNYINMSIEGFELFIRLITSQDCPFTPYQLLCEYNKQKITSFKNFITRIEKFYNCKNTMMEVEFLSSQDNYLKVIQERKQI